MNAMVARFANRSAAEIRKEPVGHWGDFALLDVLQHFEEERDYERRGATLELMLRSPEISETVDYQQLYFELYEQLRWRGDCATALRWHYAALAYAEQHDEGMNRHSLRRDLMETYLRAGEFDTGLAIATRELWHNPHEVEVHNILALTLPKAGLAALAVEVLDRGLVLVRRDDSAGFRRQFAELHQEATTQAKTEKSRLAEITPEILAVFRAALQLEEPAVAEGEIYLAPIDQLISANDDALPALTTEILAQGKVLAPELIQMASDATLVDGPALGRALALLRQLQADQSVALDELADWVTQADAHWLQTLYSPKIGKVGGLTNDALITIAKDTQYNTYVRNDAVEALFARVARNTPAFEQAVDLLRHLLTRPEARESAEEETFVAFMIGTIGDYDLKELYPEVEAAFQEDRVDVEVTDLADVQEDLGLPITAKRKARRDDGLYLTLKCKGCGRVREHFVQHVSVETRTLKQKDAGEETQYSPYVMDREIVCPKCGARDQYEMTSMATLQLMVPSGKGGMNAFARLLSGKKDGENPFKPHPRVRYFESFVMGKPLHPLEGIARYRRLIANEPQNADHHVRLGCIFRLLHRNASALEEFQKGYELDQSDPDGIMHYAMAEHDFGDRAHAKELYQEAMALATKSYPPDPYKMEVAALAGENIRALQKNQQSLWDMDGGAPPPTRSDQKPRQPKPKAQKRQKSKPAKAKNKKRKRKK